MAITQTPRLNLGKQDEADLDWEVGLNTGFDDADARLLKISSDNSDNPDPNAETPTVVDGDYIGQRYIDETPAGEKRVWICTTPGTPPTGVWELLATEGVIASTPINSNTVLQTILEDLDTRATATDTVVTSALDNFNRENLLWNAQFKMATRAGSGDVSYHAFGDENDYVEIISFDDMKRIQDRWVALRESTPGAPGIAKRGCRLAGGGVSSSGLEWRTQPGKKSAICQYWSSEVVATWFEADGADEAGATVPMLSMSVCAFVEYYVGGPEATSYAEHFTLVILQSTSGEIVTDPVSVWNGNGIEPTWSAGWARIGIAEVAIDVYNYGAPAVYRVGKLEGVPLLNQTGPVIAMVLQNCNTPATVQKMHIRYVNMVQGATIGNNLQVVNKAAERARCAAYFWKSFREQDVPVSGRDRSDEQGSGNDIGYTGVISTISSDETGVVSACYVPFPTPMAKIPTVTILNPDSGYSLTEDNMWSVNSGNSGAVVVETDISERGVSLKPQTGDNNEYCEGYIVCDAESFGIAQLYLYP